MQVDCTTTLTHNTTSSWPTHNRSKETSLPLLILILLPLQVSSIEISVAVACYYRLCAIQILWPNIKHWWRYINASIYCGQNCSHTTINTSNWISSFPPCFIHQNFGGSGMLLSTTRHSIIMVQYQKLTEIHQYIHNILWPKSLTHNNQQVFNNFTPSVFHPSKKWWQRHAIIAYVPSKYHGQISKIDGDTSMHPFIVAKIAHTQQSTGHIQ